MSPILRSGCPLQLLDWYVNQTLSTEERAVVDAHITSCEYCRHDIALLLTTQKALQQAVVLTPLPRPDLFTLVEARLNQDGSRSRIVQDHLLFLYQLVRSQIPLIRGDLWPSSTVVLIVGWIVSVLLSIQQKTPTGAALAMVAPLIAALGLSVIYGSDSDAGLELAMTTPTSPQQVLLARFVLVFGYNFISLLLLSFAFKLVLPAVQLNALLELWLGPMFFLSTMALLLSLAVGTNAAVVGSLIVWIIHVFALSDLGSRFNIGLLQATTTFWSNTAVLMFLAAIFLLVGLILVKKEEHFL